MAHELRHRVSRAAVLDSAILAVACLVTFMVVTDILSRVYHLSRADDLIGGLWAVIATVFVFRDTYQHSVSAAVSRTAATAVSFVLCLAYLAAADTPPRRHGRRGSDRHRRRLAGPACHRQQADAST